MKVQFPYLKTTCLISILLGIILPLVLGVRDSTLIAILFTLFWFLYVVVLFIETFLIEGRRLKKKWEAKEKKDSSPLQDIQLLQALHEITIKKDDKDQKNTWN